MKLSRRVKRILDHYDSQSVGVRANLARILMEGKLGGSGKMVILPVDQGFEHGPARSFAKNPAAYDPLYHHQLAVDAGLNAYAAPLGMLQASSGEFPGAIPTILKINSNNSLDRGEPDYDQAVTGTIQDALELGCSAIGYTTYPGSDMNRDMLEELREISREARSVGLAMVVWAYARGGDLSKDDELGMDAIAYGAHMACLMGADIIKVKLPSAHMVQSEATKAFEAGAIAIASQADRVREVVRSCFDGKRLVVFSGGAAKGSEAVFEDARAIRDGGGNGSIIGRNSFQRPREEGLALLDQVIDIYKGRAG